MREGRLEGEGRSMGKEEKRKCKVARCVWRERKRERGREGEKERLKTSNFSYIWTFNEIGDKDQINLLSVSFHVPFRVLFPWFVSRFVLRISFHVPRFFPRFAFHFPRSTFHSRFVSLFFFFYFANLT